MRDSGQYISRNEFEQFTVQLNNDLRSGNIQIPVPAQPLVYAGGVNHFPNSDLSYSEAAATVAGTLPGTAGDNNQRAWRLSRQLQGANIVHDDAHGLKAVGHSLYAANEGATPSIPIWNRVNGWVEMGGVDGAPQYDCAARLLSKLVKQSETWFGLFRCVALTDDPVPADVQFYMGLWQKDGVGEGYASGSAFTISYSIHGRPGAKNYNYRVMAKTDSGVTMLSAILNVPNAPAVLNSEDYVTIFFNTAADAGFIEFTLYREDVAASTFSKYPTIRNSVDLLTHDTGSNSQPATEWPAAGNAPLAYAQTRNIAVGSFGGAWELNRLAFKVPPTYDFSQTLNDGQSLRFGLTAPTAVNRQIGIDYLFFSTTLSKWAPDLLSPFPDGTYPIPSISPVTGRQGTGDGLGDPPLIGSGGRLCIATSLPVLIQYGRGRNVFRPLSLAEQGTCLKGDKRMPYRVLKIPKGTAAGSYWITTMNGITARANARHEWFTDLERRRTIQTQQLVPGKTRLVSWVRGRQRLTFVRSVEYDPTPVEVGSPVLRDPDGVLEDGHGIYICGVSEKMDRGLFCSNVKESQI